MRAIAVSSKATTTEQAVLDVVDQLLQQGFRPGPHQSVMVFASAHHSGASGQMRAAFCDAWPDTPFLGWIGASAVCNFDLREGDAGLSVLVLEDAPGFVRATRAKGTIGSHVAAALVADAPVGRARVIAAENGSLDSDNFLPMLDEQPFSVMGALSSVDSPLIFPTTDEDDVSDCAMMSMDGVQVVSAVAQGARLLGPSRQVTRAEGNRVFELDGRPALEALLADVPELAQGSMAHVWAGIANEDDVTFAIRVAQGVEAATGALVIAAPVRTGQLLAFAKRDGAAARADLEEALHTLSVSIQGRTPSAIVLVTCASRDRSLFGVPEWDAERTVDVLGDADIPVCGVSAWGEFATQGVRSQLFAQAAVVHAIFDEG